MAKREVKRIYSFRLSEEAYSTIRQKAARQHLSQGAIVEMSITEMNECDQLRTERDELVRNLQQLTTILETVMALKQMVESGQSYMPATSSESVAIPGSARPLEGARSIDMPVFNDNDTVIIRQDESAGEAATNNFHASMMAMMNMQFEESENDQPTRRH